MSLVAYMGSAVVVSSVVGVACKASKIIKQYNDARDSVNLYR